MQKSKRLQPVRQLKHQAERAEAKKLAQLQQELAQARHQLGELESYLSEYFQTIQSQHHQVRQASQLGMYQAFISRLQVAIRRQGELILQRQAAVNAQTEKWVQASAQLKTMDELIAKAQRQEELEADRKEQKILDDRPFQKRGGF